METDQAAREASGAHPYGRYFEEFEPALQRVGLPDDVHRDAASHRPGAERMPKPVRGSSFQCFSVSRIEIRGLHRRREPLLDVSVKRLIANVLHVFTAGIAKEWGVRRSAIHALQPTRREVVLERLDSLCGQGRIASFGAFSFDGQKPPLWRFPQVANRRPN